MTARRLFDSVEVEVGQLKAMYPEEANNVALDIKTKLGELALQQPRSQHSRVGMLRPKNQHTPARAAVLAAVLRTLAALRVVFL